MSVHVDSLAAIWGLVLWGLGVYGKHNVKETQK